jgi:hypothetical protein
MSVTPDFIGQIYKDTATGNLWRANSLTAGDWTLEVVANQITFASGTLTGDWYPMGPLFTGGGFIKVEGGTNAGPTGQGVTDKNTMVARGVTVTTN